MPRMSKSRKLEFQHIILTGFLTGLKKNMYWSETR